MEIILTQLTYISNHMSPSKISSLVSTTCVHDFSIVQILGEHSYFQNEIFALIYPLSSCIGLGLSLTYFSSTSKGCLLPTLLRLTQIDWSYFLSLLGHLFFSLWSMFSPSKGYYHMRHYFFYLSFGSFGSWEQPFNFSYGYFRFDFLFHAYKISCVLLNQHKVDIVALSIFDIARCPHYVLLLARRRRFKLLPS